MGRSEDGGWTCVQRDQKDSTCGAAGVSSEEGRAGAAKSTHGAERGYLLNPLLVIRDFVARSALLAEPKYPAAPRNTRAAIRRDKASAPGDARTQQRTNIRISEGVDGGAPVESAVPGRLVLALRLLVPAGRGDERREVLGRRHARAGGRRARGRRRPCFQRPATHQPRSPGSRWGSPSAAAAAAGPDPDPAPSRPCTSPRGRCRPRSSSPRSCSEAGIGRGAAGW